MGGQKVRPCQVDIGEGAKLVPVGGEEGLLDLGRVVLGLALFEGRPAQTGVLGAETTGHVSGEHVMI